MNSDRIHNPYRSGRLLGQDDWLFYWRCGCKKLLYTVVELSGYWLGAPHKGIREGCNCPDDTGFTVCRLDKSYLHLHIKNNPELYTWREVPGDMCIFQLPGQPAVSQWAPENDDLFVAHSRKHHLID